MQGYRSPGVGGPPWPFPPDPRSRRRSLSTSPRTPTFSETLLANPRTVLSELVSLDIPDKVQVVLNEESLTQIHLTMPSSAELSEADLELVAGGFCAGDEPCESGSCSCDHG